MKTQFLLITAFAFMVGCSTTPQIQSPHPVELLSAEKKQKLVKQCYKNIKYLSLMLLIYKDKNNGQIPNDIKDLIPLLGEKSDYPKYFICPASSNRKNLSYEIVVKGSYWNLAPDDIVIIEKNANHDGKKHVAFADGHVELLTEERISKKLKK